MQQVREVMSQDVKIASLRIRSKKRRSLWQKQIVACFPSEKMAG